MPQPDNVLMEEFHVSVYVLRTLSNKDANVVRRILGGRRFHGQLTKTLRSLFDRHRALRTVTIKVST